MDDRTREALREILGEHANHWAALSDGYNSDNAFAAQTEHSIDAILALFDKASAWADAVVTLVLGPQPDPCVRVLAYWLPGETPSVAYRDRAGTWWDEGCGCEVTPPTHYRALLDPPRGG